MEKYTAESLNDLLEFTTRERFFAVLLNLLRPYPGTPLYDEFLREGRVIRHY